MQDSDFIGIQPVNTTRTAAHGGRMSNVTIYSAEDGNVYDNLSDDDYASGNIQYAKIFAKAADDDDASLTSVRAYLEKPSAGDDWTTFWLGSQTDTLADITGWETGEDSETKCGVASISADVVAGSRTIKVTAKNAVLLASGADTIYRVGGLVRLANDSNSEYLTIDALSETGLEITVTTTTDISRDYTVASSSRLSSVLEIGSLATAASAVGFTGGADYDITGFAPLLDNIGTTYEEVVFTFGDSTNFTAVGDTMATLGSGTVGTDFVMTNSDLSKPLGTLYAGGWTGLTIAGGDTFTMQFSPAAVGLWQKRETPAGATSRVTSNCEIVVTGQVV